MRILHALAWLPLLLLVGSVDSFSVKGFATTAGPRNLGCQSPIKNGVGPSNFATPVTASQDAKTIISRLSQTPGRRLRIQWIRKLVSLHIPRLQLPVKAIRRLFFSLFVAVSIWLNGMNVPVTGSTSMNDVQVAHAAAPPISIRFTGAEVVARSPSGSMDSSSSPDMLAMALQKRQAAVLIQQQSSVAVQSTRIMTAEVAEVLAAFALSTGAAYAWGRRGAAVAGASSTANDIDVDLALSQQKALIDEVNTLTQVKNAATESGSAEEEVLASEFLFLCLSVLAAAASITPYLPK